MFDMVFGMFSCFVWFFGCINLAYIGAKVVLGPDAVKKVRGRFYAMYTNMVKDGLKALHRTTKVEMFKEMELIDSADENMKNKKAINILEVGVGTGTNLEFYPAGSKLTSVDPNPSFESFFRAECRRCAGHLDPDIRFICEPGERMWSVPDGSVDAVVTTLVLCSVTDVRRVLREIHRVLVPGGKLFVMDHVGAPAGCTQRRVQDALSNSGLWSVMFDGCNLNRDIQQIVESSGFSNTSLKLTSIKWNKPNPICKMFDYLVDPIMYGVATK